MVLCNKEKCVGCFACLNACPKGAISVGTDELHKTYPVIDKEKCVDCGLCERSCPVLQDSEFHLPQRCYAAWTKVSSDQKNCASGGIATALSRAIVQNNGVVFGTSFDDDLNLNIEAAEREEELEKFKGSKYVQSFTGASYKQVKEKLKSGRTVLYIGSPCQVDGLLHFLGKKYDNLFTVDIICHGVPPIKYLKDHIKEILPNQAVKNIEFRGERDFELVIKNENQVIYQKHSYLDLYYHAFLKGMIFRDNCYHCSYAKEERVSDLTIGDFWGLDKATLVESYEGKVSVVLVNTEGGQKLLEIAHDYLQIEERELQEAVRYNEQLRTPYVMPRDRKKFEHNYKNGFEFALKKSSVGRDVNISKVKNSVLGNFVKKMIGK